MKRREFVRNSGLAASAALAAACSRSEPAQRAGATEGQSGALPTVSWRLASSFPRTLDTIFGASETLAKQLELMSGGRFTIRCYPAGELVPGLQVLDAVQQGTVQVGHSASYYYVGKNPALAFDCAVPFGLTARQQIAWLEEGGGADLLEPVFSQFGVVRFLGGNTGAQMGGWFRREINSVEDIKGLKMRIPGLGGDVMTRLGATVQVLAGGDIYPALERGAIDATEWIGPYDDEKLGFHKVAKYYYYPGFWEPGPTLSFYVNKSQWQQLPAAYQAMFRAAASSAATQMLARYDARNPEALARLEQSGTQLRPFPESVLTAAKRETDALFESYAQKDATYKKIYEGWAKFRDSSHHWFSKPEQAYASFAFR